MAGMELIWLSRFPSSELLLLLIVTIFTSFTTSFLQNLSIGNLPDHFIYIVFLWHYVLMAYSVFFSFIVYVCHSKISILKLYDSKDCLLISLAKLFVETNVSYNSGVILADLIVYFVIHLLHFAISVHLQLKLVNFFKLRVSILADYYYSKFM